MIVRPATPADGWFLERMFVEAALWRPEWPKVELRELLVQPELARYFGGWGRDGDHALIAEEGTEPAGAAWVRLFTAEAPGYGFVDAATPELGLAVVPALRRRGVARLLLRQLQADGYPGLSLSVHPENPARQLYASIGFVEIAAGETAITMLWVA
jgi:ribosomal protein S18 acetylase RimI-like enzyme